MCVKDYVSGAGFEMGDHMIYPHSDEIGKQIYANLTSAVKEHGYDVNIHWREEVPERWHYRNSSRIGKIVFEPQIGSSISFSCTKDLMEKYVVYNRAVRQIFLANVNNSNAETGAFYLKIIFSFVE